jgi:ABC-2 type transport system ATP-binding protein
VSQPVSSLATPGAARVLPALDVQNLTHVYPASGRNESRTALSDLSFSIQSGEIFGLLGPNGGGKTTLFRILSTALRPTQGDALIFGSSVAREPAGVRRKIGIVFQSPGLDKKLTVRENLIHQGHLYGLRGKNLLGRIDGLLSRFKLADRAENIVESLSGGLQRRVEIAKGLIHKPDFLMMDEPTTGLDPGSRRDVWAYLSELKKEGMTILLTTHLMEEAEHCDRLLLVNEGRRVALGAPGELRSQIGGDVISVRAEDPESLAQKIQAKFNVSAQVVDRVVRIEKQQGHAFIPALVEAFPGIIESVTLGKPTLEDVFIHLTGHHLWQEPRS